MSYSRAFIVRFRCDVTSCHCDVELAVRGSVTHDGGRMYEYSTSACPKCGHRLFRAHELLGEVERSRIK